MAPDFLAPDFFAVACDLPPDLAVLPAVLPPVFPVAFPAVLCRVPDFVDVADLSDFVAVAAGAVAGAAMSACAAGIGAVAGGTGWGCVCGWPCACARVLSNTVPRAAINDFMKWSFFEARRRAGRRSWD